MRKLSHQVHLDVPELCWSELDTAVPTGGNNQHIDNV